MLARARLAALSILVPVTRFLGHLHSPWTHPKVTGVHYHQALAKIIPGQVLLTRKNGEMTNVMIPGDFTHAGIYVGVLPVVLPGSAQSVQLPCVVEAVSPRVRLTDLVTFMTTKDRVIGLTPTFCDQRIMAAAAMEALTHIGIDYDLLFELNEIEDKSALYKGFHKAQPPARKAFYCSEQVYASYRAVVGSAMPFTLRRTLDVETVIPQDFANASVHFRKDWDTDDTDGRAVLERMA